MHVLNYNQVQVGNISILLSDRLQPKQNDTSEYRFLSSVLLPPFSLVLKSSLKTSKVPCMLGHHFAV